MTPHSTFNSLTPVVAAPGGDNDNAVWLAESPKYPCKINIAWHITSSALKTYGNGANNMVNNVYAKLGEYEMEFVWQFFGVFDYDRTVNPMFTVDTYHVRGASSRARSCAEQILLCILCIFESSTQWYGMCEDRPYESEPRIPFVLINAARPSRDGHTLLHEMIHAGTGLQNSDHDSDERSIFSVGANRSVFRSAHARVMSGSFFSAK